MDDLSEEASEAVDPTDGSPGADRTGTQDRRPLAAPGSTDRDSATPADGRADAVDRRITTGRRREWAMTNGRGPDATTTVASPEDSAVEDDDTGTDSDAGLVSRVGVTSRGNLTADTASAMARALARQRDSTHGVDAQVSQEDSTAGLLSADAASAMARGLARLREDRSAREAREVRDDSAIQDDRKVGGGGGVLPPLEDDSPLAPRSRRRVGAPPDSTTASDQDVSIGSVRKAGDRLALLPEPASDLGSHQDRLSEALEHLAPCLPAGSVVSDPCDLDGELMGAVVVVDPTSNEAVSRHAQDAAWAFDGVRLLRRLRQVTRDRERARIGRVLRHGSVHRLSHVALGLDRVARTPWDESQVEVVERLRDHVLDTADDLRAVVDDLDGVPLDGDLPAALEVLALTLSREQGPVVTLEATEVGNLPRDVEEQFLRIAEEAVRTAVHHAGARLVTMRLVEREDALLLQVVDDGFEFGRASVGDGPGARALASMEHRARAIGAGLDVDIGTDGSIVTLYYALVRGRRPEPSTDASADSGGDPFGPGTAPSGETRLRQW